MEFLRITGDHVDRPQSALMVGANAMYVIP